MKDEKLGITKMEDQANEKEGVGIEALNDGHYRKPLTCAQLLPK
jgi:hypothetical protein